MSFNDDGLVGNKIWDPLWFLLHYYCSVQPKTLNSLQTTCCLDFPLSGVSLDRMPNCMVKAPTFQQKHQILIHEASDLGTGGKLAPTDNIATSTFSAPSTGELGCWLNILTWMS